jgi:hypothetical protein
LSKIWVDSGICVKNKPEWIFIKLHAHGAVEKNANVLLGSAMEEMYKHFEEKYNDMVKTLNKDETYQKAATNVRVIEDYFPQEVYSQLQERKAA